MESIVDVPLQQDERHAKGLERSKCRQGLDNLGRIMRGSTLLTCTTGELVRGQLRAGLGDLMPVVSGKLWRYRRHLRLKLETERRQSRSSCWEICLGSCS